MLECETENVVDLEAVAVCCRVLGALFYLPPDRPGVAPILASLRERKLIADWPLGASATLRELSEDFALALAGDNAMAEMTAEYQRLFIGPDALEAPPWGSVYLEEDGTLFGVSTQALRDFLEIQGVSLNTGVHEPEDHIGLLLWAAAWLAEQKQEAALRQLLEQHLLNWSGIYLQSLQESARHPFYQKLAVLTAATLREFLPITHREAAGDQLS